MTKVARTDEEPAGALDDVVENARRRRLKRCPAAVTEEMPSGGGSGISGGGGSSSVAADYRLRWLLIERSWCGGFAERTVSRREEKMDEGNLRSWHRIGSP